MVSLPSFAQCGVDVDNCILDPINVNQTDYGTPGWWGGLGGGPSYGFGSGQGGCNSIGCEDYGDDSGDFLQCDNDRKSELRNRRQAIPGCIGDPGINFNVNNWITNHGLGIYEWLSAPISALYNGIWSDTGPALTVLAHNLTQNGQDMLAAYGPFSRLLYDTCVSNHPVSTDRNGFDNCATSAYYLLENYYPGTSMITQLVNWAFDTNFDSTIMNSSWGGRFSISVDNHNACHEIYQDWQNDGCSGSL